MMPTPRWWRPMVTLMVGGVAGVMWLTSMETAAPDVLAIGTSVVVWSACWRMDG